VSSVLSVIFHQESLTFSGEEDPFQKLQLQMLGAVSESGRSMIRERQREGILKAKKKGKQTGAPRKLSEVQIDDIKKLKAKTYGVAEIAKKYEESRLTIYNVLDSTKV